MKTLPLRAALAAAGCLAAILGCGSSRDDSTGVTADPGPVGAAPPAVPPAVPPAAPTFFADVAPIFETKCVGCHQEGGIAPFSLHDYSPAHDRAAQIAAYTRERVMPPFLVETGGACGSFDESAALSDAQIATIGAWADAGALEGTPAHLELAPIPRLEGGIELKTPVFTPVIQGGALAEFDEYRCFAIPVDLDADTFLTGYDITPGNPQLVHHAIAYVVDPEHVTGTGQTNAQVMTALHAADADPTRPGWSCFGMAGEGLDVESAPAVWAPGQGVVNYPSGIGVPLRTGRTLVVQVHYNMATSPPVADQTTLRFAVAPQVERQAMFVSEDALLGSLYDRETPESLAPGRSSVTFSYELSAEEDGFPADFQAEIVSFFPHMHGRGRKFTFEVQNPADASFACQGKVDAWDFHWQRIYDYTRPIPIDAQTRLRVTCDYDTSADTEPVLPGWGTQNEMCFLMLMLALPPAVSP